MEKTKSIFFALQKTIYQVAVIHLFLLLILAIKTGNWYLLTIPDILDFKKFWPDMEYSPALILLTSLAAALLWLANTMTIKKSK